MARAEIYNISSIEEMQSVVLESLEKRNPQKTLTILSLEGVVIVPSDATFSAEGKKFKAAISQIAKKIKLSKQEYFDEIILTEYEQQLSDPKIVDFFAAIQKYDAPLMVVTSNFSGSINKIPYLEVWTWSYLFKKGIDLSKSPLGSKQIIFDKGRKKIMGSYPTFYRGLLSCNSGGGENSPQSLIATLFSVNLKWLPDVIYVVDTDEEYIKSVEQQFQSLRKDIQVMGFVYKPVKRDFKDISAQEFLNFWTRLVNKVNSATRTEVDSSKENPYEQ